MSSHVLPELAKLEWGRTRVPVIFQIEAAECGLACLAMISSYHGRRIDLAVLRARHRVSLQGLNLFQVSQIGDSMGLNSRPLRLEVEELSELRLPCLLHWDLNHYIVLTRVDAKGITAHDPARGKRHISMAEVKKHFTGVALEFAPSIEFKPAVEEQKVSLKALLGRVDGLWNSFLTVFVMALALEAFALLSPMFNQWVVDEALVSNDRSLLTVLSIGFALLLVVQTAISLARGWTVMYFSTHLNLQWMSNVFTHLLRLPLAWFEKRHLGDIVSRFSSLGAIQQTLTTGFIEAVLDGIMAVATLVMIFWYSPLLTGVVIAAVFLYAGLRLAAYGPLREASMESMVLSANAQSCFLETIRAAQAIKLFGRELDRRSRWLNLTVDSLNRNVRTQKFMLWFGIANTAVFGMEKLLVFWLGARMVMDGEFTVGMLFAFSAYQAQFTGRMSSLIDQGISFRMLSLHAERLADIVLEKPEDLEDSRGPVQHKPARIELIDVGFRYADLQPWVIHHCNLSIEPGESLAIVGPSGCGKTTLIKLILGLLPVTEGEIRYGGEPIQRIGLRAYRNLMAVVMQDDALLSGSIGDNISFFDPQSDIGRIEECARLAAVHEDIAAMPMGYHTLCGEMGSALSGGQKQRVLLARALYKQPHVLVLDEATSHLDIDREQQVNEAVQSLDITRISVAHRPQTIAMARRVVELRGGHVASDVRQLPALPAPPALPEGCEDLPAQAA